MQPLKSQSLMLSKVYGDYKLTVAYTISSIILVIDSLNGESRFKNEYFNDELPGEAKRTFGNIQNLYKYLRSNIQDSDVVTIEAPGKVILTYVYQEDDVIKSKYLTFNLSVRKPKNLQIKDLEELQCSQFEELKEQEIKTSHIKKRQQNVSKENETINFQISSLIDENDALKQKIFDMEIKYTNELEALQRTFDKRIIQVYQLINKNYENNPINSQRIPQEYRQKVGSGNKVTEERFRFLELQVESLKSHPLLVCSTCIFKQSKKVFTTVKKFCDNKFQIYIKPFTQKHGSTASKIAYYGFIGAAQLLTLFIVYLTIWYGIKAFDLIFH